MAMETPIKAGLKLDAVWREKSASKTKATRPKKGASVDEQVRKSLVDNFKSLSSSEIHCAVREGMTLRERLRRDKMLNRLLEPFRPCGGNAENLP